MKKTHANLTANARFAFHPVFWLPLRPLCLCGEYNVIEIRRIKNRWAP